MRSNKSGGAFFHFLSALLGAIIGGFLVFFSPKWGSFKG